MFGSQGHWNGGKGIAGLEMPVYFTRGTWRYMCAYPRPSVRGFGRILCETTNSNCPKYQIDCVDEEGLSQKNPCHVASQGLSY